MIAVLGSFRMPPENLAAARPAMAAVVKATRAEAGCLAYSYAEDVTDPGLIMVSERWESREHLAAHFATDHMKLWQEERAGLGLSERAISIYPLGEGEAI